MPCLFDVARPYSEAILDKNTSLNYQQFFSSVESCQSSLSSFQTIAFIPKRSIQTVIFLFAAIRQGLTICLLNSRNPITFNEHIAHQVQATFLDPADFPIHNRFQTLENKSCQSRFFIPTSASTSESKIVILSYTSMYLNACEAIRKISLTRNDRYYLSLPLYHVGGLSILFRVFLSKASVYIPEKKEPLENIPANYASFVPTQLIRALSSKNLLQKRYKCLLIGGAYLPPAVYKEAKKLPLYLSYGMSESSSQILITDKPVLIDDQYYLGWPHKYCKIKLSFENEIYILGKSLFLGYFGKSTHQKWFATKDLGIFSSRFGYGFVARKDRLFISGGENVYPEEIERAIYACGAFDKVIVIAVDDIEFGKRAVAFIQTNQLDKDILLTRLRKILPGYKIPAHFFNLSNYSSPFLKWSRGQLEKIAKKEIFSL